MKRCSAILFFVFALISCKHDYPETACSEPPAPDSRSSETEIPVAEAAAALNRFLDTTDPVTRGGRRTIASIDRVSAADMFPAATRSDEMPEAGDLLYVVNFSGDEGYAILGADSRLDTVLIVGDTGNFDPSLFDSPEAESLLPGDNPDSLPGCMPDSEQETEPTLYDLYSEEYDEYYLGSSDTGNEGLIVDLLSDYTQRQIIWAGNREEYNGWHGGGGIVNVEPLLKTCWHQGYPYNSHFHFAPASDKDRAGEQRPAGCTTIAAAQILVCRKDLDLTAKFGITGTTWEDMEGFAPSIYDKFDDQQYISESYKKNKTSIASLLKQMADGIDVKYNFLGSGGTFALPAKVKKYLERLGYDVDKYERFDKDIQHKIVRSLDKGHPVFIGALEYNFTGHAWVIDGCKYHYESDTYFNHCNFGWQGGSSNGWYYYNLFNITTGCESLDSGNSPDPIITGAYITPDYIYLFMENRDGDSFAYIQGFRVLIIN